MVEYDSYNLPPPPPLSRATSRNASTLAPSTCNSTVSSTLDPEAQKRKSRLRCNSYCAWGAIAVGALIIIILIIGSIYYAFLGSNLPEFRLQRLDVYQVNVTNTASDTLLTVNMQIDLNATNTKGKVELIYGEFKVHVSSEDIDFGTVRIPGFRQKPHNSTVLRVNTKANKMPVPEADATDLLGDYKAHSVAVDIIVKGSIDYKVKGRKYSGLPFKVTCQNVNQTTLFSGFNPRCQVKMTPIS